MRSRISRSARYTENRQLANWFRSASHHAVYPAAQRTQLADLHPASRPSNMVCCLRGLPASTGRFLRPPNLQAALCPFQRPHPIRTTGKRRAPPGHSRIGWFTWTEPHYRRGRLRTPGVRRLHHRPSRTRQLRHRATFCNRQPPARLDPPPRTLHLQPPTPGPQPPFPARRQLRHLSPLRAALPTRRPPRKLRRGHGRTRFRPHPATRLPQRIRAPPPPKPATSAGPDPFPPPPRPPPPPGSPAPPAPPCSTPPAPKTWPPRTTT